MQFHTIDQNYDYRINGIIKQFLIDHDKTAADFTSGEALMNYLYEYRKTIGEMLINDMSEWGGEDKWLEDAKEK
jgi:hypothetical protein